MNNPITWSLLSILVIQFFLALAFYIGVIERFTQGKKWYFKTTSLIVSILIYGIIGELFGSFIECNIISEVGMCYGVLGLVYQTCFAGSFVIISIAVFINFLINKFKK